MKTKIVTHQEFVKLLSKGKPRKMTKKEIKDFTKLWKILETCRL